MPQRLDAIHCLRGLAALAVCLYHINTATAYVFPPSFALLSKVGGFGVPAFFLVSGFVVPLSLLGRGYTIRAFPRFVARRMVRLDPPYFVAVGLALLLVLARAVHGGTPFPYRASDVALHVAYLSGLAGRPWILTTFWTLGIEFQYYLGTGLVVAALLPLRRQPATASSRGRLLLVILLASFFFCGLLGRVASASLGPRLLNVTWLAYRRSFLMGTAALLVQRFRLSLWWLAASAAVLFGWDPLFYWWTHLQQPAWNLLWPGVVLTALAFVIVLAPAHWPWLERQGRVLAWLGTISDSLYVTHEMLVGMVVARLVAWGRMPTSVAGIWLVAGVEAGLCLCLAWGFYLLIERPALAWSRRIQLVRAAPAREGTSPG